ncbi:MAG: hypothetical protein HY927_10565 [Elusimicrobia bacterium]|nr:hypothetical protein [Elusimicrobiota bacterium]
MDNPSARRSVLLAFFPGEKEQKAREHASRIGAALGLPEQTAVVRRCGTTFVVEAARPWPAQSAWDALRERAEETTPALEEALGPARLRSAVYCGAPAPSWADELPRTALPEGEVVDLAHEETPGERLALVSQCPDRLLARLRPVLARLACAKRQLEIARTCLAEVLREKQVVDDSVNRILRHRIGEMRGAEALSVLEEHVREMSQNFAKLTRNAGIVDGALSDFRAEVQALERDVKGLPRTPAPALTDDALARLPIPVAAELTRLERQGRSLNESLSAARTALQIHAMNVEILRGEELVALQKSTGELQKKAVSFQSAAVLIELVVVFAYTLHSWELIAHAPRFQALPGWFTFFSALGFALLLVLSAHEVAHRLREGRFSRQAYALFGGTVALVAAMAGVTAWARPPH